MARAPEQDGNYDERAPLLTPHGTHQQHHFHMDLEPTVYTSAIYAPIVSRIRFGHGNSKGTRLAIMLVAVNMVLQVGLLRIMDIYGHRERQMHLGRLLEQEDDKVAVITKAFLTREEKKVMEEADDIKPFCTIDNNKTFSCMPPSVHFASHWHALDLDGDGVWTMAEATAAEKEMANKTAAGKVADHWIARRPVLVFNSIINGLNRRSAYMQYEFNRTLYVSPNVRDGLAVPKAYFEYWVGDAMFCTRFDRSACDSIVASGLFDAALTKGRMAAAHKGIRDYESATQYCQMMLQEGGGCEQSLPPSFRENRLNRKNMCGEVSLHAEGSMTNPGDPNEVLPVLVPSYKFLETQKGSVHSMFLFFKMLLIYLYYTSLVGEVHDLIKHGEFILRYPGLSDADDPGGRLLQEHEYGPEKRSLRIHGISSKHRLGMGIVYILRVGILIVLCKFGSWFLLAESRYIELVLNALALAFITGIDELLYDTFWDKHQRHEDGFDDCERIHCLSVLPGPKSWIKYVFARECWGLILIPCITVAVVLSNAYFVRQPMIEALTCTCLQDGGNCAESMIYQESWWRNYWAHMLPAAIHQIQALELQGM